MFISVARADFPTLKSNGDGTKTVAWWMNTTQGLTVQGVDLTSGNATLPWRAQNVTWKAPANFTSNGTLGANLSTTASGISLRSDSTNHVPDGDFATAGAWSFTASTPGNVTAKWNATNQLAIFRHASPSTESLWDGLNSTSGWSATSSAGALAGLWENTTGQREGGGMLGLNLTLPSSLGSYAGAQHLVPVNWSRVDRMVVWILPLDVSSPIAFNITAFVGASLRNTTARPLHAGWQEIAVDLKELGPVRDTLVSLTLRVTGRNVGPTKVYFDDIRVGVAKKFDETASVHQTFQKVISTWGVSGSASLRFNWTIANATGVVRMAGIANLSGPSGSFERTFGGTARLGWSTFVADVSRTTAAGGAYNVNIALEVVVDNTSVSSAEARVDDVSLVFPNRHNGSYLSNAVALGEKSEFLRISWACDLSSGTAVRMSIRSGNSPVPEDGSWSAWQTWPSTGTYSLSIPGAAYIQVGVDLATTNASQTPQLHAMDLATRHRASSGSIISVDAFKVPPSDPFLRWRSIRAIAQAATGTSISFAIGDGTYFQTVGSDGNLSAFTTTSLRWKAVVATTDGLVTPSVARVELVYENRAIGPSPGFLGDLPFLWYGGAFLVAAVLGYVGYEFVIRRMFSIDDLFLISKDGRLLMHNTRRMRADRDPDILSAMLTAILSFLRDSDPEGNGELRRFQIGDKTTILERGVHAYLAAVYSGRVPRWARKDLHRFMANLESRFGEAFARWTGDPEDLQGLRDFTTQFVSHLRYRPPRRVTGRAS